MNILHTEASCGWGGQEIRILEEARGLIARGHQVTLVCPPQARIHDEAARYGVPVRALPIGRKNLRGLFALRRYLKSTRPDVINTHSSTDAWLAALACATLHRAPPIVRTRHISAPVPGNATTRWLYTRATTHIVTTGERLRESLIRDNGYPPAMLTSVPTGIDVQRFEPGDKAKARRGLGLEESGHYLGILATLRSWKGHLYLLEAFKALNAPDWRLLIVGDGPMREQIEARISTLGLADRVILAGQRQNPEDWLRAMDVFCLPSYANEGVPQALLQAMLTGLPIVTTPVGAITEAIEDGTTGLVVPPRDADALAYALGRLMGDAELSARLGAQARQTAENRFSRTALLDAMETLFQQVQARAR
jgi:glycosyltransferase involved in cell wall biosynthesis